MPQKYAFFSKPPRKPQEICKLSANYHKTSTSIILSAFSKAVPARTTWRRPLWSDNLIAKRFQAPEGGYILPFSRRVSVPCEGNRKGRKAYCGLVRMWSSPCRRDGEVEKSALRAVTSFPLMVKGKAWFRIKDPPSRVSVPYKGNRKGRKDY